MNVGHILSQFLLSWTPANTLQFLDNFKLPWKKHNNFFFSANICSFKLASFKEERLPYGSIAVSHVGAAILAHVAHSS